MLYITTENMTIQCKHCDKIFKRELDFTRHEARKTPCYRNLACFRCGIIFTKIHT